MSSKIRQIAEESKAVLDKTRSAIEDAVAEQDKAVEAGEKNFNDIDATKKAEIEDSHKKGHDERLSAIGDSMKKYLAELADAVGVEGEDSTETFYGIVKIAATEGANWQDQIAETADKREKELDEYINDSVGEFSFGEES